LKKIERYVTNDKQKNNNGGNKIMVKRKWIDADFENLLKAMKKQRTKWTHDPVTKKNKVNVGSWSLDYNSIYGGYNIEEVMNESGGVNHPFGERRKKPTQFRDELKSMIRALELKKRRSS